MKQKPIVKINQNNPVQYIADKHIVEDIIRDYMVDLEYKDDLIQEIYLILLNYNKNTLIQLIQKNQIKFFIARIVRNTWFSQTSEFYRKFKKQQLLKVPIDYLIKKDNGDNEDE